MSCVGLETRSSLFERDIGVLADVLVGIFADDRHGCPGVQFHSNRRVVDENFNYDGVVVTLTQCEEAIRVLLLLLLLIEVVVFLGFC